MIKKEKTKSQNQENYLERIPQKSHLLNWSEDENEIVVLEIGKEVSKKFQDKSNPLYERRSGYFTILESYNFINWKTNI